MITKYYSTECEREYDIVIGAITISLNSITNILERYYYDLVNGSINTSRARLKIRHPSKIVEELSFFGDFLARKDDVFTFLLCDPKRKKPGFLTSAINCAEEILHGKKIGSKYKGIKRGDIFGHFLQCPIFIVEFSRRNKKYEQAGRQVDELYGIYSNLVRNSLHVKWFRECVISQDPIIFSNLNPFASDIKEFINKGGLAVVILDTIPEDLDSYTIFDGFLVRKLKRGFIEPKRYPYVILSTKSSIEKYKSRYYDVRNRYREIKRSINKVLKDRNKQKRRRHIVLDMFSVNV